jgi:hypothetical protein
VKSRHKLPHYLYSCLSLLCVQGQGTTSLSFTFKSCEMGRNPTELWRGTSEDVSGRSLGTWWL